MLLRCLGHTRQPRSTFTTTRVQPQLALLVQTRAQLQVSVLTQQLVVTMLQPDGVLHHLADRRTLLLHCSHTLMMISEALCDCELAHLEVGEFHSKAQNG